MKPWPTARLGEVLTPTERGEAPMPGTTYRQIGVKLWGEGAYERETMDGSQTKYAQLFRAEAGDIIVNKIWARNGSVAVVPESLAGCFGSSEFPMFSPKLDRLESRWMHWLTKTREFWAQCDEKSRGTSGKNRIKPEQFLSVEIPLPPFAEQRRVVARIEELGAQIHEARTLRHQAAEEAESLMTSRLMHLFDEAAESKRDQARLGDVCTFQGGSQPAKLQFAYEPREGYVRLIQIRDYKSDNYPTFVPKDSVRKFCTADDVMIGRYGPPIFQILRGIEGAYNVALMKATPDESLVSKDYLFRLLQEPRFFQKVEEDSQRTSGQTGIRRELLEDHITFVPPLAEQRRIVSELDALQAEVDALKRLQAETAVELAALLPSILNKAFKGEL